MILGGDVGASYTREVLRAESYSYSSHVQLNPLRLVAPSTSDRE